MPRSEAWTIPLNGEYPPQLRGEYTTDGRVKARWTVTITPGGCATVRSGNVRVGGHTYTVAAHPWYRFGDGWTLDNRRPKENGAMEFVRTLYAMNEAKDDLPSIPYCEHMEAAVLDAITRHCSSNGGAPRIVRLADAAEVGRKVIDCARTAYEALRDYREEVEKLVNFCVNSDFTAGRVLAMPECMMAHQAQRFGISVQENNG